MPSKETTIYDIAKVLNVSPATVSRGLNDHPSIGKKTREKIKEQAREMGYRSNALASSLRTRRSRTLGVIVPRLNSYFMSAVLAGMEEAASQAGYHLIIMQSFESKQKEKENTELLFHKQIDGLLVSTSGPSTEISHFEYLIDRNIPVVFFDRPPATRSIQNHITIDNFEAARKITDHLIERGCRNIMHVTGDQNISVYQERTRGYRSALNQHHISERQDNIRTTQLNEHDSHQVAEEILNKQQYPDALFIANDTSALTIMSHLTKNGIQIPGQIKIAGFNNDPFSSLMMPTLTTINYPGTEMGIKAVHSIVEKIEHNTPNQINITLDHQLIQRESTKVSNQNK